MIIQGSFDVRVGEKKKDIKSNNPNKINKENIAASSSRMQDLVQEQINKIHELVREEIRKTSKEVLEEKKEKLITHKDARRHLNSIFKR